MVAIVDCVLHRLGDEGSVVELLQERGVAVVFAVEWIECSKHGLSRAQRLGCVPSESISVRPDY